MSKKLRIRKLTPSEAIRLMGFERKDYEAMAEQLPDSGVYHCAGDSIVTTCLVGMFGQLLGIDPKDCIEKYADKLAKEPFILKEASSATELKGVE